MSHLAQFEIVERIGHGGMGVVYKARDTKLRRTVAIKVLPAMASSDPERRRWLLREARAAAALNHPSIATVYEVGEASAEEMAFLDSGFSQMSDPAAFLGPVPYIVMEYVEGEDLKSRLARGPLETDDVLRLGRQIARGLAAAHRAGIVHRDLKPGNVMLTPDGDAKLLDFSLAKFVRQRPEKEASEEAEDGDRFAADSLMTSEGMIIGTIPYMAPEQLEGVRVDERSDLFSLGVLLYEMAAGGPPFSARGPVDYFRALEEDPVPLSAVRPEVSKALERVVHRLLALDAEHRYPGAFEVAEELASSSEMATFDDTVTISIPRWQPATRKRLLIALGVFLLLILGFLIYRSFAPPANPSPRSLAIVPIENRTGNPNRDYLCRGISAVLVSQLRQIRGLDTELSKSDADWILKGTMHRTPEGRIAIEATLTDPAEYRIWSKRYEEWPSEVLGIQTALANDVLAALDIHLSAAERRYLARPPTQSAAAFDVYLQGLSFLESLEVHDLIKARDRFLSAIDLDEGFALAYADLSQAYWELHDKSNPGDESLLVLAEQTAKRADDLLDGFPEAQLALAQVLRSSGEHPRAITLLMDLAWQHPDFGEIHRQLAITYTQDRQFCEAKNSARKAVESSPSQWRNWNTFGTVLLSLSDYDGAKEAFRTAAERAPPSISRPFANLIGTQVGTGDFERAIEFLETASRHIDNAVLANSVGTAYFFTGRLETAEEYYRLALSLPHDTYQEAVILQSLGDVHRRRGEEREAAREYLAALDRLRGAAEIPSRREKAAMRRALLLAKVGQCDEATRDARRLSLELNDNEEKFRLLAMTYAICSRDDPALREQAFEALRRAALEGAPGELTRLRDEFEPLYDDPRFEEITRLEPQVTDCVESE